MDNWGFIQNFATTGDFSGIYMVKCKCALLWLKEEIASKEQTDISLQASDLKDHCFSDSVGCNLIVGGFGKTFGKHWFRWWEK